MKRRVAALVAAGMLWSIASQATAQTTTTSSSTTSSSTTSSTTSSSTTSTSTTSTTIADVNPCAGRQCTENPPAAFLAGVNGEVRLDEGSYCWSSPTPNAQGQFSARCVDKIARTPDAVLRVRAGEHLTLRFAAMAPTEVSLERNGQSRALTAGNPVRFVADLPVGVHEVRFFTKWAQGSASHAVRLDVRAATTAPTSDPRPLALTG